MEFFLAFSHLLFLLLAAKVPNVARLAFNLGTLTPTVTSVALLWSVPA